jgi:hypothetical protein
VSDTSQGPGWWLASDGKWYPPATAPGAPGPPAAPTAPPGGVPIPPAASPAAGYAQPPGYAQPVPVAKKSGNGCLIAVLVVVGLIVVGGIGSVVVVGMFAHKIVSTAFGGGPCPFLSNTTAASVLGPGTTVFETRGFSSVLVVVDPRVMPNDPSCALSRDTSSISGSSSSGSSPSGTSVGRIARYKGGNAQARYQAELAKAKGVTEDRGNGLSVSSEPYLNKELSGVGDEAFCTKSGGVGAGMLVRSGDVLVYASLATDIGTSPGIDLSNPDNPKLGTDDGNCVLAQKLALAALPG